MCAMRRVGARSMRSGCHGTERCALVLVRGPRRNRSRLPRPVQEAQIHLPLTAITTTITTLIASPLKVGEMSAKKNFCRFSRQQDDRLIQLVSAQPVVYDASHPHYKDLSVKDNVWKDISTSIQKTVEECKVRWRSIRDLYNRKKKEACKNPGLNRVIKWEYMDQLGFLDRANGKRQLTNKTDDADGQDAENSQDDREDMDREFEEDICLEECSEPAQPENDEPPVNPIEPEIKIISKRKRRRTNGHYLHRDFNCQPHFFEPRYNMDRDPISLFFSSMAQTVMTFPPSLATEAKAKVCRIITDLEHQAHLVEERSYPPSEGSSNYGGHSPNQID